MKASSAIEPRIFVSSRGTRRFGRSAILTVLEKHGQAADALAIGKEAELLALLGRRPKSGAQGERDQR